MTDSIFNTADQQEPSPTTEAENEPKGNDVPGELQDLVGEGKKYKSVEDALRSIPHAQEHISRLEQEMQQLREDLDGRLNSEETLKQILERQKGSEEPEAPSDQITPDVIKDMAKSAYEELTQEEKRSKNIQNVDAALRDKWGEKAAEQLKTKADELGVSLQFMQETAAHSPQAFYNLVGLDKSASAKPDHTTAPRQGDVNAANMATSNAVEPHTYRWYQQLRKDSPKEYYSPKVQMQMHKDANDKGDSFYN